MADIRFLIKSGWRVAGSDAQRRELSAYIKYVVARNRWRPASTQIISILRGGVPSGNLPPNFSIKDKPGSENLRACDLALPILNEGEDFNHEPAQPGIRLATKTLADLTPPWEHKFEDPEDTFAAHRFGWLLPLLADNPPANLVFVLGDLARRWIETHSAEAETEGWDGYSVSERIVNWIFLLAALKRVRRGGDTIEDALRSSIQHHANYLRKKLEFRGAATNNHLINNGRGLYFAGTLLGDSSLQGMGREILRYGLREMFTASGFLREGSSHYHLLLCRTYLEVCMYAQQSGDRSFVAELHQPLTAQVKCASWLLSHASFPLIGDVSPDAPPEFHSGVAAVGVAMLGIDLAVSTPTGPAWHTLVGLKSQPQLPAARVRKIHNFPDAGYYCVEWPPVKLTVYVNPLGYVPAWSHGHGDLGGFILEWDGQLICLDCGRPTYEGNSFGRYGRSARSHNTIMIDRHEPCVIHAHNGFVPSMVADYYDRPTSVEIEEANDAIQLRVRHFGFQRLQNDLIVSRTFTVSPGALRIADEVQGSRSHLVETFFHFHPRVELGSQGDNPVTLAVGNQKLSLGLTTDLCARAETLRAREGREPAGWFFPRYGEFVPTFTLRYSQNGLLPLRNVFTIAPA